MGKEKFSNMNRFNMEECVDYVPAANFFAGSEGSSVSRKKRGISRTKTTREITPRRMRRVKQWTSLQLVKPLQGKSVEDDREMIQNVARRNWSDRGDRTKHCPATWRAPCTSNTVKVRTGDACGDETPR